MNFQNFNVDHVERPRDYWQPQPSHLPRASGTSSSTRDSQITVSPYGQRSVGGDGYASSAPVSTSPQPTVVPQAQTPPSPSSSSPEIYGPERLLPPVALTRNGARGPRSGSPIPIDDLHRIALQTALAGQMVTGLGFKDELALAAGKVTPGVDDSPYILHALDALNGKRDTGYSQDPSSSGDGSPYTRIIPDQGLGYYEPPRGRPLTQPAPVRTRESRQIDTERRKSSAAAGPQTDSNSTASLATLVQFNPTSKLPPIPADAWTPIDRDELTGDRALVNPRLTFRPRILRPLSLMTLMTLCTLMVAALIFCAVYSRARTGLWAYGGTIYDGRYFLFRIFPQMLATIPLLFAQCIISTIYRIMPFMRMDSHKIHELFGALFEDIYPSSFLWPHLVSPEVEKPVPGRRPPPRLKGTWQIWVPVIVTWLINFTLPLQSCLFTVIYVDGEWRWTAVQGVAWTLVALYLLLLISTGLLLRYWSKRERTGLLWDPRSIADVVALFAHSNTLADYRGTELLDSRRDLMLALPQRNLDRLGYWSWLRDGRHDTWYSVGTYAETEKLWLNVEEGLDWPASTMAREKEDGMPDLEASSPWDPAVRRRHLPWCLRTSQLLAFTATAFVLLVALFVVSFLPATSINHGFLPLLSARPRQGAFSSADFLYGLLPSFLGLLMFLSFQSLDLSLRVLQPWAELQAQEGRYDGGARPGPSLLADYAACLPVQSSWHALRNGHYRTALVSLLATLFVFLPVLSGGLFMALTQPDGTVKMFVNAPLYGVVLALLVLYLLALISLLPGRDHLRLPHGVTCLAEIVGFCAGAAPDDAFRHVRDRASLERQLGADREPDAQPRWLFGVGAGRDERLGLRRARRYTERETRESAGGSSRRSMVARPLNLGTQVLTPRQSTAESEHSISNYFL